MEIIFQIMNGTEVMDFNDENEEYEIVEEEELLLLAVDETVWL